MEIMPSDQASGRHNMSRFQTAEARIRTRARVVSGCVSIETAVRYHYGNYPNAHGCMRSQEVLGGRVVWRQTPGDVARLGRAWGEIFDLVAGVIQNLPRRVHWTLDISAMVNRDAWTRGALEAMVYSIAHELDLDVETEKKESEHVVQAT